MNKIILLFLVFYICINKTYSQIGIGTDSNDQSAVLEIFSNDEGVLFPRLDIPDLSLPNPVNSPAIGLFAYNTNTTSGEGYVYWDGATWRRLDDKIRDVTYLACSTNPLSFTSFPISGGNNETYNFGDSTTGWSLIPGVSTTIEVTKPTNTISMNLEGGIQMNNSINTASMSYSLGIFVDGALRAVRVFIMTSSGGTCSSDTYQVAGETSNLAIGEHLIEVRARVRRCSDCGTEAVFGSTVLSCLSDYNNYNSDMGKVILNATVTE